MLFHAYEVSKKLLSDYEVVILYLNVTVTFTNRFYEVNVPHLSFYCNFFKYVSSVVLESAFNIRLISLIILPIVSAIWKKSGVVHHTFPSLTAFKSERTLL